MENGRYSDAQIMRIYCDLELNLRIKPKKRLKRDKPEPLAVPERPNETWSYCPATHACMCERGFHGRSACRRTVDQDVERFG